MQQGEGREGRGVYESQCMCSSFSWRGQGQVLPTEETFEQRPEYSEIKPWSHLEEQ